MAETDTDSTFDDHARTGAETMASLKALELMEHAGRIIAVGRQMRQAQKRYFATRDRADLIASKRLEKQFDELIK